jgi:hypothetical protein
MLLQRAPVALQAKQAGAIESNCEARRTGCRVQLRPASFAGAEHYAHNTECWNLLNLVMSTNIDFISLAPMANIRSISVVLASKENPSAEHKGN